MKCKKCKTEKHSSQFYKNDGRCKTCLAKKSADYYKTKNGVISRIYLAQKSNSKSRGHVPPAYSKDELKLWLHNNPMFHSLYDNWVLSDYDRFLKPSCDRLNERLPYSFSNIELKTYGENLKEAYKIASSGERCGVPVIQMTLSGEVIRKFNSISSAERETNTNNIFYACSGRRKKAGGFKWKFAL